MRTHDAQWKSKLNVVALSFVFLILKTICDYTKLLTVAPMSVERMVETCEYMGLSFERFAIFFFKCSCLTFYTLQTFWKLLETRKFYLEVTNETLKYNIVQSLVNTTLASRHTEFFSSSVKAIAVIFSRHGRSLEAGLFTVCFALLLDHQCETVNTSFSFLGVWPWIELRDMWKQDHGFLCWSCYLVL